MSGVDMDGRSLRKGAADAVRRAVQEQGGDWPPSIDPIVDEIARGGATPLVVTDGTRDARRRSSSRTSSRRASGSGSPSSAPPASGR